MGAEIIVGVLSFAGTLIGSFLSQRKSAALIAYRLEQLEIKVDKHNCLVERNKMVFYTNLETTFSSLF